MSFFYQFHLRECSLSRTNNEVHSEINCATTWVGSCSADTCSMTLFLYHLAEATKIISKSNISSVMYLCRGSLLSRVAVQEMFCTRQHVPAYTYISSSLAVLSKCSACSWFSIIPLQWKWPPFKLQLKPTLTHFSCCTLIVSGELLPPSGYSSQRQSSLQSSHKHSPPSWDSH